MGTDTVDVAATVGIVSVTRASVASISSTLFGFTVVVSVTVIGTTRVGIGSVCVIGIGLLVSDRSAVIGFGSVGVTGAFGIRIGFRIVFGRYFGTTGIGYVTVRNSDIGIGVGVWMVGKRSIGVVVGSDVLILRSATASRIGSVGVVIGSDVFMTRSITASRIGAIAGRFTDRIGHQCGVNFG